MFILLSKSRYALDKSANLLVAFEHRELGMGS